MYICNHSYHDEAKIKHNKFIHHSLSIDMEVDKQTIIQHKIKFICDLICKKGPLE